ncbi:alpha-ketoacid dehydrogenase subunit beta [Heliobacillus mobilis]|uniref:Alpha-ketoacid dehydrogenase subunit beta n=1 Tax=Heliobacterium mobile TaxID=28064 RepID=A0A6I3SL89_HELMO|nr:pyruvate dehydrogenase complex E1 component subunit beta [Heliobacterium mobile]MTV49689.1 alpha-ketoacid dehydrogenase subunit beta [Heliobacterium mobile]
MSRSITYRDAINEAILQEMKRDERVFVYGIDVADHKRIFGSTRGLVETFGPERCFSTPLSEDALTGMALGAAVNGLRPILVHMRVDFMLLGMNQIANMISSFRYGSGGLVNVPLVIRAVIGRGWGQSYQHSKTMHASFAHIPGIKVVMPATPYDAKGMLISAIRDDNPVIFIEHRWLYDAYGEVPEEPYTEPLSQAKVLRSGKDITIVATSWMNVEAVKAAEVLSKAGISAEVIDARSISPFDETVIVDSVKKTGHCIVIDDDWIHCGFGAEVAARVSEQCFGNLKSPVERMGYAATPCPCARPLENLFYPNAVSLIKKIENKFDLEPIDLTGEDFYSYEKKFRGPF